MRVAQIMLARGFGGAERSFVDLSLALAAQGHQVLAIGDTRGKALPLLVGQTNIQCVTGMADRAKALSVFQSHTPSKTVAATVIGIGLRNFRYGAT